jgi:Ribbon-helix-helix protein, copG family.
MVVIDDMVKKNLGVYLDEENIQYIDEMAKRLEMNRSAFLNFVFNKTAIFPPQVIDLIDELMFVIEKYRVQATGEEAEYLRLK